MDLTRLFCDIDDFCQEYVPEWKKELIESGEKKRDKECSLSLSEIMTIIIAFHQSNYRTFKWYYTILVSKYWTGAFPHLVSYNRFVELMGMALVPLCAFVHTRKGKVTGIAFVDSTIIRVCNNLRISIHKVFKGVAKRGKTSTGWFYGFKLHLIINEYGELLSFKLTPGNVDDRNPVPKMTKELWGKLFGDKGYISKKLFKLLFKKGVQLITSVKKNMQNILVPMLDKILLRKRSIIETVNDQLKNISQIEHSRHRSIINFMVNIVSGLIAYTYQEKKPSLHISRQDLEALPMAI